MASKEQKEEYEEVLGKLEAILSGYHPSVLRGIIYDWLEFEQLKDLLSCLQDEKVY